MPDVRFGLFGFPVHIAPGAFILAGIILVFGLSGGGLTSSLVFVAVAVASILLHELGHAFAAKAFRLQPIDITLHGFGGMTRHRRPDRPWKALLISLAGPGAGLAVVPVALGLGLLQLPGVGGWLVEYLFLVNLVWSLFNLLPVYPLDGGQALGSILAMVIPSVATTVTVSIGLVGAVIMGVVFLVQGEWWIVFIAGMLASQNYRILQSLRRR